MVKNYYFGKKLFTFNKFKNAVFDIEIMKPFDNINTLEMHELYTVLYCTIDNVYRFPYKTVKMKNYLSVSLARSIINPKYIHSILELECIDDGVSVFPCCDNNEYANNLYEIIKNELIKCMGYNQQYRFENKIDDFFSSYKFKLLYNENQISNFVMKDDQNKHRQSESFPCRLWNKFNSLIPLR